jgi:type I restriction enzyme R subunit
LREAVETENWSVIEQRIRSLLTNHPNSDWDITKLEEAYKTNRKPSLREILAKIFGIIPAIPTRAQLADQAYERFVATQNPDATHSRELRTVFIAFLLDPTSRQMLEHGRFPDLRARDPNLHSALSALPAQEREALIRYLKSDEVSLKEFEKAA